MTDLDSLVRRVAAKARETTPELPPGLSAAEVAAAEEALGFTLPPLLARLYVEIADGGFGPDYQLYPLNAGELTAVGIYQEERAESSDGGNPHWPAGVLPILTWGCGMYAAVDCQNERASVLLFEPNGIDGDWTKAWFVDAASLEDWLESWLNDSGWFSVDDYDGDEELPEPSPWSSAADRLAAP
ncbi:SMI1/KNR4 family protein [Actinomadura rudentiformis]|uniref:SMI1/KNR4 family protein n=1 Tax=Actinomadura rudentiformis TaxID=359158 RepID=A0A6H9YHX5_9ACTN|nr:SMI1/KNR4 family protein [Actinomadura rudentiformis]